MPSRGANRRDEGSSILIPPGRPRPVSASTSNLVNFHDRFSQSMQTVQSPTASRKSSGLSSATMKYPSESTKYCLCSPTSHAGSFRCRLHRSSDIEWATNSDRKPASSTVTVPVVVPDRGENK